MEEKKYDLEARLLEYAASIVRLEEKMESSRAANHVGSQMLRSGTSAFFNHGEAQAAESPNDFVHKMGICLKELRETRRALLLIRKVPLVKPASNVDPILNETEELIKIFFSSIRTARRTAVHEAPGEAYHNGQEQ